MVNFIPQEKIAEIQHTVDIIQIISKYVHLKQKGKNFSGLCPFHTEKTPSFIVNPERKFFKCFGCGEGGTVFHFVMKYENVDFVEAVKLVASMVHIDLSQLYATKSLPEKTEKSVLLQIQNLASQYYQKFLFHEERGKVARNYLKKRQISEVSIRNFQLGFAPNNWTTLIKYGNNHGITAHQLEKAGLVIATKGKNSFYDRFRNRLMFPIFNVRKQVIGFGGRSLDDSLPKYLNSPETILFNKSEVLYGIDQAKSSIIKEKRAIIMEGYTDVIMAHQFGITWAVAVLGTSISKSHLKQLRQYCNQIILLLDSDTAGLKSSDKNLDIFLEEEFDVKIARLPENYDPCDVLITEGAERFLSYINNAIDFFSFKIEIASLKWDLTTINGKAQAIDDILATAMKMPDLVKRNLIIKLVAEKMAIDEETLRKHLKKFNKQPISTLQKQQTEKQKTEKKFDASSKVERELIHIMLSCNKLIPQVVKAGGLKEFHNKDLLRIAEKIFEIYNHKGTVTGEGVLHSLEDGNQSKILMNILTHDEFQGINAYEKRLEACIHYFKRRNGICEIRKTKKKTIESVNASKSEEDIDFLLHEFHKKNRNIHALKKRDKGKQPAHDG